VSIVALSSFDTDYVLIKAPQRSQAIDALRQAGHSVEEDGRLPGDEGT
jgi:hypothetical protein